MVFSLAQVTVQFMEQKPSINNSGIMKFLLYNKHNPESQTKIDPHMINKCHHVTETGCQTDQKRCV